MDAVVFFDINHPLDDTMIRRTSSSFVIVELFDGDGCCARREAGGSGWGVEIGGKSARWRVATKKASRQIHENVAVLHVDTFFPPPKEYVVINVKAMSYIAVSTNELE